MNPTRTNDMGPPSGQPSAAPRVTVVVLLSAHVGLLLGSVWRNFMTIDEIGHVRSGVSYWQTGRFGEYRVNPPLMKLVAALPVLAACPGAPFWEFDSPNVFRHLDAFCLARLPGIGWSLLAAAVIYRWARDLYGGAAGCLGLALWCFDPNVLAHAPLATPDVPATAVGVLATYAFWRYLREPTFWRAASSGLLLGVAQLTKFTLLILYVIWPLLWLIHFAGRGGRPDPVPRRLVLAAQALVIGWISLNVINAGFLFHSTGYGLDEYGFRSRTLAKASALIIRKVGSVPVPLPYDYVKGIDDQRKGFEAGQPSYIAGRWSARGGWWYYYLYALAVKVPVATWVMVAWAAALTLTGHPSRARWRDEATVWLPAVVMLAFVSSQTGFSKHMRYVLPMFPFVMIGTSKLAWFLRHRPRGAGLAVPALLAWSAGSSLAVYPHSLSYFNEVAGGPGNGHAHLIDSNIDWGQDLLFLKAWLDEHPEARPLGLAFFHYVDPSGLGVAFEAPPPGPGDPPPRTPREAERCGPHPGWYALSVNYLRGLKGTIVSPSGRRTEVNRVGYYSYFLHFRPVARAGYSVYIYHISPEEANAVRRRLGLPPLPAAGDRPADRPRGPRP